MKKNGPLNVLIEKGMSKFKNTLIQYHNEKRELKTHPETTMRDIDKKQKAFITKETLNQN